MSSALDWRALRARAEEALRDASVDRPAQEAQWMIERISGYDAGELQLAGEESATDRAVAHLDDMLARRVSGEPLQYVLGQWSFRGVELFVDARVLIPRPETEVVAEVAIEELVRLGERRSRGNSWTVETAYAVADLGTGSGAIALALAHELPDAEVWATDVSDDALDVARANVAGAGTVGARVRVAAGSWFDALPAALRGRLRLVVSNPPYVSDAEAEVLPREVLDHEPAAALFSGPTGLESVEVIVGDAGPWLEPAGVLVCEIAPHQARDAVDLALRAGFVEAFVRFDLAGRDRVLVARRG